MERDRFGGDVPALERGRSQVQIHEALNIDRKTIRKYLVPALVEGLKPTPDELFDELLWRERIGRWFPELVDRERGR